MVRLIALLAFAGLSTLIQAEELDHARLPETFGSCMYQCQLIPDFNQRMQCQLTFCGGLHGSYVPPAHGACASLGGSAPGFLGCPGGTHLLSVGDGLCCVPLMAYGGLPIGLPGTFPGYGVGPTCNPYAHAACVTQYNCPQHPESQGCYTFCALQSGC